MLQDFTNMRREDVFDHFALTKSLAFCLMLSEDGNQVNDISKPEAAVCTTYKISLHLEHYFMDLQPDTADYTGVSISVQQPATRTYIAHRVFSYEIQLAGKTFSLLRIIVTLVAYFLGKIRWTGRHHGVVRCPRTIRREIHTKTGLKDRTRTYEQDSAGPGWGQMSDFCGYRNCSVKARYLS
jgi:hypothetical protein